MIIIASAALRGESFKASEKGRGKYKEKRQLKCQSRWIGGW